MLSEDMLITFFPQVFFLFKISCSYLQLAFNFPLCIIYQMGDISQAGKIVRFYKS